MLRCLEESSIPQIQDFTYSIPFAGEDLLSYGEDMFA